MSTIDLNNPPPGHKYNLVVDLVESPAERNVRLIKDITLFFVAVVFVGAIFFYCFSTLYNATATAEEQKWAMSVLWAIGAGLLGYLLRK